ncbi:MAG: ATP-binding protein [Bacillota bacterium]|nr:ATP-binding protein [Bacillota bacterium]
MLEYADQDTNIPCITERRGAVVNVSPSFCSLVSFRPDELIGKTSKTVFRDLLRIKTKINYINGKAEAFLFTKFLDARYVSLEQYVSQENNLTRYIINEIPDSRLEFNNQFLVSQIHENITAMAVYSVPDYILIKANQMYLNYLPEPYNVMDIAYGKGVSEIIPEFNVSPVETVFNDIALNGKSRHVKESKGIMGSGNHYWDSTLIPIVYNNQVKFIVSVLEDVTERVVLKGDFATQSKLLSQEEFKFKAIIENMFDGLLIFDKQCKLIAYNRLAGEKMNSLFPDMEYLRCGCKNAEFNQCDRRIINNTEYPAYRVVKGEKLTGYEVKIKKGDAIIYAEINGTPVYDEEGELIAGILCCRDLTEHEKAKADMESQRGLLETVIENITDAFAIYNKDGSLVKINAAGRNICSINQNLSNLSNPDTVFEYFSLDGSRIDINDLPSRRALRGETVVNTVIVVKGTCKQQTIEVTATPIFDKDNNLVSIAVFHRDITDKHNNQRLIKEQREQMLQKEIEKSEALKKAVEMKDEFLCLISHEFKTPITVINTAIQAIEVLCRNELSEKMKSFLNTILQNSNRQLKLVNNLLDITRIHSGHFKNEIDNTDIIILTRSIIESIKFYAEQKGINLLFSTTFEKKVLGIDKEKYERILLNLLSNAVKYTPRGKSIRVMVSQKTIRHKRMICIEVIDEGPGIPQDKQKLIFEKFGQVDNSLSRQAEGTGIGLYLTKVLVEVMNGEIILESKVGLGSNFTILLPAAKVCGTGSKKEEITDNRLVRLSTIEFSDIYL